MNLAGGVAKGLDRGTRFGLVCASLKTFLPIFLPGFFLLAAGGAPGIDRWTHHREAFGSGNYYLVLAYAGSPEGILSPGTPARFSGTLTTEQGELAVRGERQTRDGVRYYRIETKEGVFEGRTIDGTCGAQLYLTPRMTGARFPVETLRSPACL